VRLHARDATHGIAKAFLSVRPSVKRVDCDKTKDRPTCAHMLIPYERKFILDFHTKVEEWLVGTTPCT